MVRIVLVQYWLFDHLGIMTIAAYLKKKGHEVTILVKHEEGKFLKKIEKLKPDIVGFTCTTGIHVFALKDIREIKNILPETLTLIGGNKPTFEPDIINEEGVDVICRGEGELAFEELCGCIADSKDFTRVKNLWVKKDGKIYKNEIRPLIQNLDSLPYPDREHYNSYKILRTNPARAVTIGRGCVFNCSFCSNGSWRNLYKGKGGWVRKRSISHVIEEIKEIRQNHFTKYISFEDDDFLDDDEWITEFLTTYAKEVKLPFACLARFDNVTEKRCKLLKEAGCYLLQLGIDSGNEEIRQKLLNKCLPDEKIIESAALLKKYNVKFRTYNILGFPGETTEEALDTLEINKKIHTDFPTAFIWQPYSETALAMTLTEEEKKEMDYVDLPPSLFSKSIVNAENKQEIESLQKLFGVLARTTTSREFALRLVKLKFLYPVYHCIYKFAYLIDIARIYRINIFRALGYGLKLRKLY